MHQTFVTVAISQSGRQITAVELQTRRQIETAIVVGLQPWRQTYSTEVVSLLSGQILILMPDYHSGMLHRMESAVQSQ